MVDNLCHQTRHSSSRIDIRFIKPQALLALSIVICAWRLAKVSDSQDPKSLKNIQRIGSSSEEAMKLWNQKHRQKREPGRD
jgi:hypothetical protein